MKSRVTRSGVTFVAGLGLLYYEAILGGGRATVISAAITMILVTPAVALDAYRRGKALTAPPPGDNE